MFMVFKMVDVNKLVFAFLFVACNGHPSSTPPKTVNLAVETSLLFEPEDVNNATLLASVRQFIDNLEAMLNPTKDEHIFRTDETRGNEENSKVIHEKKPKEFTKFLTEIGGMVINYDEEDVKNLLNALNEEITAMYVSNPKFHEMFKDIVMKMFIKNTVKEWMITNPLKLKVEIAKYIISEESSAFVTFFRNLNQFFEDDKAKLMKITKKFKNANKTKKFNKPLAKTFALIFERFDKLNDTSKNILRDDLNTLKEHVIQNYNKKFNLDTRRILNTAENELSRVKDNITTDNFENNENEIRFDRNVQFSVHADNNPNI